MYAVYMKTDSSLLVAQYVYVHGLTKKLCQYETLRVYKNPCGLLRLRLSAFTQAIRRRRNTR